MWGSFCILIFLLFLEAVICIFNQNKAAMI